MTTDKKRLTVWMYDTRQLDDLVETARRAAPLADRGRITRSTAIEAAVALALDDVRRNGAQAALLQALVTLPRVDGAP